MELRKLINFLFFLTILPFNKIFRPSVQTVIVFALSISYTNLHRTSIPLSCLAYFTLEIKKENIASESLCETAFTLNTLLNAVAKLSQETLEDVFMYNSTLNARI